MNSSRLHVGVAAIAILGCLVSLVRGAQVPILVGTSLVKALAGLKHRRGSGEAGITPQNGGNGTGDQKPPPVLLEWQDLRCSVTNKKTGSTRELLAVAGGAAKPGRLLAIMGPSGSGAQANHHALGRITDTAS